MKTNRRQFIAAGLTASTVLSFNQLWAGESSPPAGAAAPVPPKELMRPPPQDFELVKAIVGAGHGNLDKVKELVAQDPKLVLASWDRGGGDWESALQGA